LLLFLTKLGVVVTVVAILVGRWFMLAAISYGLVGWHRRFVKRWWWMLVVAGKRRAAGRR
jgi:hypothetical protein